MEKRGVVEVGKTPSAKSGDKSTKIVEGEALADNEAPAKKTIEKVSKSIDND